jgi:tetratricopeptide (TPR) repeat protein
LQPAFEGRDRQELLRQIAFEEPKLPRQVNKAVPVELETIVRKALEKNPADRYATAQELADDLGRWLKDEPIRARRPSLGRRARKWAGRHRSVVWSVATALALTLAVLGGSVGWVTRDRAARRLEVEQVVGQALDETRRWQAEAKLPEALGAARQAEGVALGGPTGERLRQQVRARLADLELLERLENVRLEMTTVKDGHFDHERAEALYGEAFRALGLDVAALSPEEAAEGIRRSTVAVELAAALDSWAVLRRRVRGPDDSMWRELLRLARAVDPDAWRGQVREALTRWDAPGLAELVKPAEVVHLLPPTLYAVVRVFEGSDENVRIEALLREAQRQHPSDFWTNHDLAFFFHRQSRPPQDDEAIRFFTAALVLRPRSPGVHLNLGNALNAKGRVDEAVAAFREALRLKPDYYEAHINLGGVLDLQGRVDEAIAEWREAVRLKPDDPIGHNNLGNALDEKGRGDEAIAEWREALRLKPDYPTALNNLGGALADKGRVDEAIAALRKALRLKPDFAEAHANLGDALRDQGRADEAIAAYREALRLKPGLTMAHNNLGVVLRKQGHLDEAIAAYREALRLKPDYAEAHYDLGGALRAKGQVDEAVAAFGEALRLKPDYAEAHCNLGLALRDQGRFTDALATLKRGHELGTRDPRWPEPSARWVRECERLLELDGKLPAILSGQQEPADAAERIALADLCRLPCKKRYAAATRLYVSAFAAEPKLADDQPSVPRYNAACCAALAGCGRGEDAAALGADEHARLRRQALDWLRADVQAWRKVLDRNQANAAAAVQRQMRHWLEDADFAGVRGPDALARLPETERPEWLALWADVARALTRAEGETAPEKKPAPK